MSTDIPFTKNNIEYYLNELAKEFKKRGHRANAEMVLVGGASVILNYDFRPVSLDIDAFYEAQSIMKECINVVGDKFGLQQGWVNDDFKKTASFTPKIIQYSEYYKTFANVLQVRTVKAEYLLAMKLVSARQYKKDLSDIAGILYEQRLAEKPLTYEQIDTAVCNLYGDWHLISDYSKKLLTELLATDDLESKFIELSEDEKLAKETIIEINAKYPEVVTQDNVNDVIAAARRRKRER